MIRHLLPLLLLASTAAAQSVPNPATAPIPTNAALKTAPGNPQGAIRLGFAAAGDGGYARYDWLPGNCTAADDGAQVQPTGTGCWVAAFDKATPVNVRVWGAKGDEAADDGPAFRAACAYALSGAGKGVSIGVPTGKYLLKTLDARGNGALYLSNGADDGLSCSLIGTQGTYDLFYTGAIDGPAVLKLGDSLNRPLIQIPKLGATPHLKNLTLDGNRGQQTGWPGGPDGKLYTVDTESAIAPDTFPETGVILDNVVMQSGYNGNLHINYGRMGWGHHVWSVYSGSDATDCSVRIDGYDTVFFSPMVGSNTGCGMWYSSGSQHQIFGGAIWSSTEAGLRLGGLTLNYMSVSGTNLQYNKDGIENLNLAPYAGTSAGGVTCTNCTFDGNTEADVIIRAGPQVNRQIKLISPAFLGNATVAGARPVYTINIVGGTAGVVDIVTPSIGNAAAPYTTAFTNAPQSVYCSGHECPSTAFLPTLGNGTPTYTLQQGYIVRAGQLVHLNAVLTTTALGGPTGNMAIGNVPTAAALTGYFAPCAVGALAGWTGGGGRTFLVAQIPGGSNFIALHENGSGLVQQASPVASWAAATTLSVSCTYIPAS